MIQIPEEVGVALVHEVKYVGGASILITLVWWGLVNLLAISMPYLQLALSVGAVLFVIPYYDRLAFPHRVSNDIYIWRIAFNFILTFVCFILIGPLGFATQVSAPTNVFQMIPAFLGITGFISACRGAIFVMTFIGRINES